MTLVENIKRTCQKRGIRVSELERRAGLPLNSIYKWDKSIPSVERVKRAADVLEVTIDKLME